MENKVEKLSLLSDMISFTKNDKKVESAESFVFLLKIANQLGIPKSDLEYLLSNPIHNFNLNSHSERIVQFHRLVLLSVKDYRSSSKELVRIHNFGLRMGLSYEAICRVLELMESFPQKKVPADFLIDIFKVQYN